VVVAVVVVLVVESYAKSTAMDWVFYAASQKSISHLRVFE
jgi:hypothetical protein